MATHSSILAWEILWTEEPGWLQPMGLQRVGHNLATKRQQHEVWMGGGDVDLFTGRGTKIPHVVQQK